MALTNFTKDMAIIQKLDDEPNDVGGLSAAELKAKFDEGGEAIKEYLNGTLLPNVVDKATKVNGHPLNADVTVTKADVGLGSVDNTSDAEKPVSTEQQAALDKKADKANVLEKNGTTPFTPTADTHPATKGYVDQVLAGATLGQLPDSSVGVNKLTPELNAFIAQQMPVGGIILWSGAANAIPVGWALCDGQNGTPDLRGRFILGAGSTYQPGDSGGRESLSLTVSELPSHTHSFSGTAQSAGSHSHGDSFSVSSAGSHSHSSGVKTNNDTHTAASSGGGSTASCLVYERWGDGATTSSDGSHTHSISGSVSSGGAHTHSVTGTVGDTGGGAAFSILPPYYALCYLMKMP